MKIWERGESEVYGGVPFRDGGAEGINRKHHMNKRREKNMYEEVFDELIPMFVFTPAFCLLMYLAAKAKGVCKALLLVLAHVAYGIYLCIL